MLDKIPPQNIALEEAILGGILLDPCAIERVAHFLKPEHFYVLGHRKIYNYVLELHRDGESTDLMSVTSYLSDKKQLEAVGGQLKLANLIATTVSAVNIDLYAHEIIKKYIRRHIIEICHSIEEQAYDTSVELEEVIDFVEKKFFEISNIDPESDLVHISDTLSKTLSNLEKISEEGLSPGFKSGFYDLDEMTGGFQRSDLIVVAGRPSMGKTAFCTNIAYSIAMQYRLPVAFFSLEMSREQLAQRLLSGESNIEGTRMRRGEIASSEWEPIATAMGNLCELPIYVDDSVGIKTSSIASKLRRLKAEHGDIGLIILDYLQLMGEDKSTNRVQEL
jgi:replicative DNA helicase